MSGVKLHFDRLWYRRTFDIPSDWAGKCVNLHFGAVDYEAEVFVNGKSFGIHSGGYDAFSFDITSFLTPSGPQELIVRVYDPTEFGGQPRGKQTTNPESIMYTSTTGIWHRGLTKEARAAIEVDSDNVLAVHGVSRDDKQWVDAGLDLRIPQD